MECLYGFLSNISRDLVCGAVNQLCYPCCFNNFVKELEKEERSLITTRKDVKDHIAHEKKQTRRTPEVVHKWDEDADKYVDDVNQLLNEARTKQTCCFGHCPDWIFRYRSGKKLANKKTELEEFIKRGEPYVLFKRAVTLPSGILDFTSEKYLSFVSRQKACEELMEAVKDDEVGMIGLYGMGGCGKTTLAMDVQKKAEAEHLFDKVLFVPVSSTVEVRRIQDKIASSLGFDFPKNENEERERAERLKKRLSQENKILVILDDVWQILDFGATGIPSAEHHKGCKVLITTRSEDVCTSNDCQKKIQLQIFTNEEAWALFQKQAHISDDTSDKLKRLARQISDECKGLPVAIAAVASTLKGKDEVIWKDALNRLKSSELVKIEKGLEDPYKCLKLSYDNLDDEEAKSLFLLCSVFPEDYEIPIELLTRYAIGLGVVGEVRSYEVARNKVIAAKIKLVSSCLLLYADDDDADDDERVKMHDLVRDVAHWIAKNENKAIKCEVENDVTLEQNSVRYLWCKKLPNDLDYSNLEFLCINTAVEVLDDIFTRMRKLRVLHLVNEGWDRLPLSTMSFKTLTNLRCLILSQWELWDLSDISFLRYMKKLESLWLSECSLPSFLDLQKDDAVTQLTKLKLLVLCNCEMERNIFEVIGRIPQLEELCILDGSKEWDDYSENTIEIYKTFSVPQTLQRYTIAFGSRWYYDGYKKFLSRPPERTLMLSCFDISNEAIIGLAKKAKTLKIGKMKGGVKNIIPNIFQLEGGGMPELNKLRISDSKEIECLVDSSNHTSEVVGSLFSNLLQLNIDEMHDLRVLWHGCLPPSGTFTKLESLHLRDCPKLTSLFTKAVTPNPVRYTIFQNLQEMKVISCGELKYVFSANTVGGLPQLKSLYIEDCDKLEQIVEDIIPSVANQFEIIQENTSTPSAPLVNHSPGSFILSKLTTLKVYSCRKLGSLFPASTAKTLISLEELRIYDCRGLKHLLSCERDHNSKKQNSVKVDHDLESIISMFLSLKKLVIRMCDLLQHIFPVFPVGGQNNIEDNSFTLQHLKEIEITGCAKLEVIFPMYVVTWLSELESLQIKYCKELKYIFSANTVGGLPQLKSLYIEGCDRLEQIVEDIIPSVANQLEIIQENTSTPSAPLVNHSPGSFTLSKLTTLQIYSCQKLGSLFPASTAKTLISLEELRIYYCRGLKHLLSCERDHNSKKQNSVEVDHDLESIILMFLSLKKLVIRRCDLLQHIFPIFPVGGQNNIEDNSFTLQNLKEIEITGCAKLEVIFPMYVVRWLSELESLWIKDCKELKYVSSANTVGGLPQLKSLYIACCDQLEQIVEDIIPSVANQLEIIQENTSTRSAPLVNHSPGSFTLSKLTTLQVYSCPKLGSLFPPSTAKTLISLEELITIHCRGLKHLLSYERDHNSKSVEDDHDLQSVISMFLSLKRLVIKRCDLLQHIFSFFPVGGQNNVEDNSFTLQHFKQLEITGCAKLEVIFPMFAVRCLPELESLQIKDCKELKYIMKEDDNDRIQRELKPCFPKLKIVVVEQCHKLKRLFSASASDDLPNLEALVINGANELEELIGCEQREYEEIEKDKVELPKLKLLILMHLSNLCQGIELCAVKHSIINIINNCPKLSLTSTPTLQEFNRNFLHSDFTNIGYSWLELQRLIHEINKSNEVSESGGTTEIPSSQSNEELEKKIIREVHGSEVHATATSTNSELNGWLSLSPLDVCQHETHSQELLNGQSTSGSYLKDQQKQLGETDSTIAIPQNIKIGVEEATASENAMMVSSHLESTSSQSGSCQHESYAREWHSKPENTCPLQMNQEDPSTSKSKSPSSQVNDNNQSIPGTIAEMVREHKQIQNEAPVSKTDEFLELERERKMTSHLQLLEQNLSFVSSPNMTQLADEKSSNEAGFLYQHALGETMNIEEIGKEIIQEGSKSMRATIKTLSTGVESISLGSGGAPDTESSGGDILMQHSQVVDQDDKLNEGQKEIQIQEELSLMDKKEGIGMVSDNSIEVPPGEIGGVSNDRIVARINEEPEKEFVAKIPTSEILTRATSLKNSQLVERSSPSYLDIPLHKTHSNSESESHPKIIEDFGANDIMSLFQPVAVEEHGEGQVTTSSIVAGTAEYQFTKDNRVVEVLAELEKCLKMPLRDIASSETYILHLLTALNFLSGLPFKDATLSDGLEDIIDSMHKEIPSILCSFKQGFATNLKLTVLEAQRNKVDVTLVSKISEAENLMDEAQQKEAVLKERVIRLMKEINDCEVALSSLQEENKKRGAETIGYKKELENVRKDKSQMVEDQRKVEQELLEVAYKWSVLCSKFELNRIVGRNPS